MAGWLRCSASEGTFCVKGPGGGWWTDMMVAAGFVGADRHILVAFGVGALQWHNMHVWMAWIDGWNPPCLAWFGWFGVWLSGFGVGYDTT